jgi:GDP-L-fucose synthase
MYPIIELVTSYMKKDSKIFVAGHKGLVGSAIVRTLEKSGYQNIITRDRFQLDLENEKLVSEFFKTEKPEYVFMAAAKVGGILANNSRPVDFLLNNLKIQNAVIQACYESNVSRLLFLGSSCIYPKFATQPLREESLLTGQLEKTNRPYALAKIAGIELCWSYNRQYGTKYLAAMPTNLYGPKDNYDLNSSHVLPALIKKVHEAKLANKDFVEVWGTGNPKREFLYSDDLAEAAIFLINLPEEKFNILINAENCPIINVGTGSDLTIRELAEQISKTIGFKGRILFDVSKPDGTPRKLMDVKKINELGWKHSTSLETGIARAYEDFKIRFS